MIKVHNGYYPIDPKKVEEKYGAKYLGDFCVKVRGNWTEQPRMVFHQPNPDTSKGHGPYFGIHCTYIQGEGDDFEIDNVYISNAESAFSEGLVGLEHEGDVYISCFRHHYHAAKKGVFIDGGRDYTRSSGGRIVDVVVTDGEFVIKDAPTMFEFFEAGTKTD